MKTILIISQTSSIYGAPQSMIDIISGLSKDIKFIVLIPDDGPIVTALRSLNIEYYIQPFYFYTYSLKSVPICLSS